MTRRLTIIFAMILANSIAAGNAVAKPSQFSCTGVKIEPASQAQSPMTVKLNLVSARKVTIDSGGGDIKNSVTSDDQITLRFRTKDFIGEFFHYTNDLFLIYHSGHLAKLSCTPAQ
jgi:hypothetical protein